MNGKISGVRYGLVVDNIDETGADRIAVRIIPEDNDKRNNNAIDIHAFPLLPKTFYSKPKIGEGVFVLFGTANDGNSQRYYIGPVTSQIHRIYFDPARYGGDSYQKGAQKDFDVNPYIDEEAYGSYPSAGDVAIMGRKSTDIILKDDDIRIRAGVRLSDDETKYKITFNTKSPAYIKLKHHYEPLDGGNESTATIVADKINLISNKSYEPNVDTADPDELITDDEMNKILQEAYRIPYGEKLVKLLKQMIDIFCNHTHDFAEKTPNKYFVDELTNAAKEPLDQMKLLSDGIRIN